MKRSKRVLLVSHCVLNQNAVVKPLARAQGAFNDLIQMILEENIAIYQMPCPENDFLGLMRAPMSYEEYQSHEYSDTCDRLADRVASEIQRFKDDDVEIVGLLSIGESPTCSQSGQMGHFIEALQKKPVMKGLRGLDIPEAYGVDAWCHEAFNHLFKQWLKNV